MCTEILHVNVTKSLNATLLCTLIRLTLKTHPYGSHGTSSTVTHQGKNDPEILDP